MNKKMKVIKRDGRAVEYNREKIEIAIEKANKEVQEKGKINKNEIKQIIDYIEKTDKKRMNINIFMFKYNKKSVIIITRC